MTSDRTRTQVYLDRHEHRRLRRLAAERGVAMTELVREAVGRYLVQEGAASDLAERFYDDICYWGIGSGPSGLVGRMRARARMGPPEDGWPAATGDDVEMGDVLAAEHDRHLRADEVRG